jgi:hypothetical protein
MKNQKIFIILFLVIVSGIAVKATTSEKSTACTRQSWASTDPCKNLAVATKDAPKDIKNEIERLASLTVTSAEAMRIEHQENKKKFEIELQQYKTDEAKRVRKQNEVQAACFESLGKKFDPTNYYQDWPSKCMDLATFGPSQPSFVPGGPQRQAWAQAWLDLSTLAKTFPQYIQPSSLSTLINVFEDAKACVLNKNCIPNNL